jgi:hypothetical protein
VLESSIRLHEAVEDTFAGMSEGRVAEVVRKRYRLAEILVEAERAAERTGDLRGFDRMRQACSVVVAFMVDENLGLVLEPAKRRAVNDAIAIALERQAEAVLGLGVHPPLRVGATGCVRGQRLRLTS